MSARKIRRAAAREALNQAREAGFPTDAQLAANRANAQFSAGPVTSEGRAVSSQNRTTHGLTRRNSYFKILPTEDPADFEALKESLAAEHQPTTAAPFTKRLTTS